MLWEGNDLPNLDNDLHNLGNGLAYLDNDLPNLGNNLAYLDNDLPNLGNGLAYFDNDLPNLGTVKLPNNSHPFCSGLVAIIDVSALQGLRENINKPMCVERSRLFNFCCTFTKKVYWPAI